MPEPIPRPTRFLLLFAALGARKLERFFAINFLAQRRAVRLFSQSDSHLSIPSAYLTIRTRCGTALTMPRYRGGVFALHYLIEPGKAQAP